MPKGKNKKIATIKRKEVDIQPALAGMHAAAERVDITPPCGISIGGFSIIAQEKSRGICGRLFANVLVLGEGEERLALVQVDLHAGTWYLSEKIASLLPKSLGLSLDRVVLCGSHTHSGPGGIYGTGMYDKRGSSSGGFYKKEADTIAKTIAEAIKKACGRLASSPAKVGVGRVPVWEVSANKSMGAWKANGTSLSKYAKEMACGAHIPSLIDDAYRACDVRMSVVWAEARGTGSDDGRGAPIGAIGFFGAHNSSMNPLEGLISGDSFGYAARYAADLLWQDGRLWPKDAAGEPKRGRPVVGLAIGAGADVNVCGPSLTLGEMPGAAEEDDYKEVPREVGQKLAAAIHQACHVARATATDSQSLAVLFREAAPTGAQVTTSKKLAWEPQTGRVAAGASEFGRYFLLRAPGGGVIRDLSLAVARTAVEKCPEGTTDPSSGDQKPKVLMKLAQLPNPITDLLRGTLPERLPFRIVKLGSTWLVTVPFEVTTGQAWRIEKQLKKKGAKHVVLGTVAGGYSSYVTTKKEYDFQAYEGSSVLWGPHTGKWLENQLDALASHKTSKPVGVIEFEGKQKTITTPGKDIDTPKPKLTAKLTRDLLTAKWVARKRDCPPFADGPWARIEWKDGNDWSQAMLFGAKVNDQEQAFRLWRTELKKGRVRWRLLWSIPRHFGRVAAGRELRLVLGGHFKRAKVKIGKM